MAIGSRLKEARNRSGLTRPEAAEKLGVPARSLKSWENGEVSQPAWSIPRLATLYGVSSDYLLAPDSSFLALIDHSVEGQILGSDDLERIEELVPRLSVFVTDHASLITSAQQWVDRVMTVGRHAQSVREGTDESGETTP